MWRARCGPRGFWLAVGWVNSEVVEVPPALVSTVFASSNMKCALASLGWLGMEGYVRFPLNLVTLMFGRVVRVRFVISIIFPILELAVVGVCCG